MATNIIVTHYGNYTVKDFYSYYNSTQKFSLEGAKSGERCGEGVPLPQWGGAMPLP